MADIIQFVLLNVLMVSVGVVLVLVVRTLPRVDGENVSSRGIIERLVTSEVPEKLDAILKSASWKLLRRLRVFVLKFDNAIHRQLSKMKLQKEENGNGGGLFGETASSTEEKTDTV